MSTGTMVEDKLAECKPTDSECDYEDKNNKPWMIEDIVRGNCSLFVQAKVAVLGRRWRRRPRINFSYGFSEEFELSWVVAQTQGYRGYQEDRTLLAERIGVKCSQLQETNCNSNGNGNNSGTEQPKDDYLVFGVFDGHGQPGEGHKVSEYAVTKFTSALKRRLEIEGEDELGHGDGSISVSCSDLSLNKQKSNRIMATSKTRPCSKESPIKDKACGKGNPDATSGLRSEKSAEAHCIYKDDSKHCQRHNLLLQRNQRLFRTVFEGACRDLDTSLRINMPTCAIHNGTTMCALLIGKETLVFANCGDSRAAYYEYSSSTHKTKLKFVTLDHKPTRVDEAQRIRRAGGWVDAQRVNGDLAVSRTLGDLEYKPRGSPLRLCPVSNQPKVDIIPRILALKKNKHDEELYLLATDGLWDAISTIDALDFIKARIREHDEKYPLKKDTKTSLKFALTKLIRFVSIDRLSSDNITIILIHGQFAKSVTPKEETHSAAVNVERNQSIEFIKHNTARIKPETTPTGEDASKSNDFHLNSEETNGEKSILSSSGDDEQSLVEIANA